MERQKEMLVSVRIYLLNDASGCSKRISTHLSLYPTVNLTGTPGACGFVSQILPQSIVNMIYPVSLKKEFTACQLSVYHETRGNDVWDFK